MATKKPKSTGGVASEEGAIKRPADLAIPALCATFLAYGFSQEQAANAANIGERTLRRWMSCRWWPEAVAAAPKLHPDASLLLKASMGRVLKDIAAGGELGSERAWAVVRAMLPEFKPQEVAQAEGGASSSAARVTLTLEQLGTEGARMILDAAAGGKGDGG